MQDLRTTVDTFKIVSELSSYPVLHIPVLDEPNNTADCALDDTLLQSTVENVAPVFLLDPQSLPNDTDCKCGDTDHTAS